MQNRVVIITGAASGIGRALTHAFAALGARLCIADKSANRLTAVEQEIKQQFANANILSIVTDVSIETDCKEMTEACITHFGRIDILINNAGISMRALFKDLDLVVIKNLMDVNFWGTVYCTKYALPHLLTAKGSVIGVSSIAGFKGLPARTGYSASKFAIQGFLETLRIEHLYDGLHVMVIAPGFTASNIRFSALTADGSQQGETPRNEGKMMSPELVAQHIIKGIQKRKAQVVLTLQGKAVVWLNKFFPRFVDRMEYKVMSREPDSPLNLDN
ncbi:MAG: SDR family oxidoreductase [Bacteroidales bacterium]|nr:SDR family oxidoreductase [Bacteroidales bacterium]